MIHHARKIEPTQGWLLVLALCCAALGGAANGQEPKKKPSPPVDFAALPKPNLKTTFHQDFRGGDPKNANLRFIRDGNILWEAEGARITMPSGQGKIPTTGVAANFKIHGDFQITASYEILKAEQPTEGFGVGVSIYVAIDPDAGNAVSLARRLGPKGNISFMSDRMQPHPTKPTLDHYVRTRPAKAPQGKLRMQRVGTMLRFLIADGDSPDFVPIAQDNKKRLETPFGSDDIRYFQVGGDAGDSQAALDVRLLDLTVEAEELPGIIGAPAPVPAALAGPKSAGAPQKSAAAHTAESSSRFGMLAAVVGGVIVLLLALGLGAWFVMRRRARVKNASAKSAEPPPDDTPAMTRFVCPDCGKKLRVKAESAGKKFKCPNCGTVSTLPKADAIENPQR